MNDLFATLENLIGLTTRLKYRVVKLDDLELDEYDVIEADDEQQALRMMRDLTWDTNCNYGVIVGDGDLYASAIKCRSPRGDFSILRIAEPTGCYCYMPIAN